RLGESYGIEYQLIIAKFHRAKALVGLRRFGQAARLLDVLERGTDFASNTPLQRARLHASVGDLQRALDVLAPLPSRPAGPSSGGELAGWRALVHAAVGESERAQELAIEAAGRNDAVHNKVLAWASEALVAADAGDADTAVQRVAWVIDAGIW